MKEYLEHQISELGQRLSELDRERISVQSELRAYKNTLERFLSEQKDAPEQRKPLASAAAADSPASSSAFKMSSSWVNIFHALHESGKSFNAADIMAMAEKMEFDTKTKNIRAQIFVYKKRGFVRKVNRGRYTVTDKGFARFEKERGSNALTSEPPQRGDVEGNGSQPTSTSYGRGLPPIPAVSSVQPTLGERR